MRIWPPPLRLLLPVLLVIAILAIGARYLGPPARAPLEEFAPTVDPAFRRMLVEADDATFRAHCRDLGESLMTQHWFGLSMEPLHGTPGAFMELEPHLERFAAAYGDIYQVHLNDHLLEVLRRTPADVLAEANRRATAINIVRDDTGVPDSTRIATILADRAFAVEHGLTWLTVLFDSRLIRMEMLGGRREAAWHHLQNGLADARRVDHMMQLCQLLGVAYQMHMEEGRPDSAYHYLDLAEARARRSRSAYHTARILSFRAAEARAEGRLGACHLHLIEAWRACQDYRGGGVAIRTLLNLADMYEDLGCWLAQEQILATIRTTESLPPRHFDAGGRMHEDLRIRIHDLRSALAHGDSSRGLALMDSVVEVFGPEPFTEIYARFNYERAALLIDLGRFEAARAASEHVLDHVAKYHLIGWEATLRVQQATIALARADTAATRQALAVWRRLDARGVIPAETGTKARAVALDVLATRGAEQVAALRSGLSAFQTTAFRGDAGVSSYLRIAAFDELRWAIHDLLADDPALGLDFDMRWRQVGHPGSRIVCPDCGSPAGCDCPAATPGELLAHWSRPTSELPFSTAAREAGSAGNLAHVLYVIGPRDIRRWWTDAEGTRSRILPTTPRELSVRIAGVDNAISLPTESGTIDPALAQELRDLGRIVLPEARMVPGLRLLITAEGSLSRLPFGALDVEATDSYRPLQDEVLVAYLRRADVGPNVPSPGITRVVVGDAPLPEITRRRPDLGALPGAAREGAAVAAAWPRSEVLSGSAATKHAVLAGLADVSRMHIASHVVQDAATPYLSFIPLAARSGRIEDAMLEPRDVLQADLGPCDLVVLSGCSSGVPFVAGTRQAPSFGDVFLDAGVTHAVQALWDVDDDATALVMSVFARLTAQPGDVWTYAEALREATALLRWDESDAPHPFNWAPWFVTTTDAGF